MATCPNFPNPVTPPITTEQISTNSCSTSSSTEVVPSSLSPALALVSTTPASLLGSIQPVLVHTTGAKNYTREGILVRDKMKKMKSLYLVRPGEAEIYTPADKQTRRLTTVSFSGNLLLWLQSDDVHLAL